MNNETALFLHLRSLDKSQNPTDERERAQTRDAIIGNKMPLVESVVRRLLPALGLSENNDGDDLRSEATIALILAVDKFDPEYGVPFDGFAALRIAHHLRPYARDSAPMGNRRAAIQVETGASEEDFGFVADFSGDFIAREAIQCAVKMAIGKVENNLATERDVQAWTRQKRALELRFVNQATCLAIGLDLGVSPEAAQKILNRAFDRLRVHLQPLLEAE